MGSHAKRGNCNSLHILVTEACITGVTCTAKSGVWQGFRADHARLVVAGASGSQPPQSYFPPITSLAIVCNCIFDVPS
jgi:hypothetical protein